MENSKNPPQKNKTTGSTVTSTGLGKATNRLMAKSPGHIDDERQAGHETIDTHTQKKLVLYNTHTHTLLLLYILHVQCAHLDRETTKKYECFRMDITSRRHCVEGGRGSFFFLLSAATYDPRVKE